ncbi:MAG: hypothetical protein KA715_07435 [Xanthomonadaceae bacterium]|nr:hypothetical protein [Xanthomonadaceae bacterium]
MKSLLIPIIFLSSQALATPTNTANKDQCEKKWQGNYVEEKGKTPVCILNNRSQVHQISLKGCDEYKTKYNAKVVGKFCVFRRPEFPGMVIRRVLDEKETVAKNLLPAWEYCVETWKKNIGAKEDPSFVSSSQNNNTPFDVPACFSAEPTLKDTECKKNGGTPWGSYCRFRNLERPTGSGIKVTYYQNLTHKIPKKECMFGLKNNNAIYRGLPCSLDVSDSCNRISSIRYLGTDLSYINRDRANYEDYLNQLTLTQTRPSADEIKRTYEKFKIQEEVLNSKIEEERLKTKILVNQQEDFVIQCHYRPIQSAPLVYPPATFDEAMAKGFVKLIQKPIPKDFINR